MPSYHIWIRKEDDLKWNAIKNKPDWLHERLNEPQEGFTLQDFKDGIPQKIIKEMSGIPDVFRGQPKTPSKCPTCNKYACEGHN